MEGQVHAEMERLGIEAEQAEQKTTRPEQKTTTAERMTTRLELKTTTAEVALQPFKFKVIHRPGAQMAVADFLSRNGGGGLQAGGIPGLSRVVGVCGERGRG